MKVKLLKTGKIANLGTVAAKALIKTGIAISLEDETIVQAVQELKPEPSFTKEKLDDDSIPVVKKKPGRPRKETYKTKILTAEV